MNKIDLNIFYIESDVAIEILHNNLGKKQCHLETKLRKISQKCTNKIILALLSINIDININSI